jgi:hypothetical protein
VKAAARLITIVIPAKAGIQPQIEAPRILDPRFRGDDNGASSPDGAQRNPGTIPLIVDSQLGFYDITRREIYGGIEPSGTVIPDCAALHPGYVRLRCDDRSERHG